MKARFTNTLATIYCKLCIFHTNITSFYIITVDAPLATTSTFITIYCLLFSTFKTDRFSKDIALMTGLTTIFIGACCTRFVTLDTLYTILKLAILTTNKDTSFAFQSEAIVALTRLIIFWIRVSLTFRACTGQLLISLVKFVLETVKVLMFTLST